jgi:hypothetical protein
MTITNPPPSGGRRTRGNASPSTRLPSARERRPALAALAVLLIAGGAVLAGWLALRQSQTETYLMVDDTIHYGQQIDRGDLRKIELPPSDHFVPADDADDVIGAYAQVELVPDTVLAGGMYGDAPTVDEDQAIVGLELDPSQFPKTFRPGDPVIVIQSNDQGAPIRMSSGVVRSSHSSDTGGGAQIDIVMSNECSSDMASASSFGNVQITEVSPNAPEATCLSPEEYSRLVKTGNESQ